MPAHHCTMPFGFTTASCWLCCGRIDTILLKSPMVNGVPSSNTAITVSSERSGSLAPAAAGRAVCADAASAAWRRRRSPRSSAAGGVVCAQATPRQTNRAKAGAFMAIDRLFTQFITGGLQDFDRVGQAIVSCGLPARKPTTTKDDRLRHRLPCYSQEWELRLESTSLLPGSAAGRPVRAGAGPQTTRKERYRVHARQWPALHRHGAARSARRVFPYLRESRVGGRSLRPDRHRAHVRADGKSTRLNSSTLGI